MRQLKDTIDKVDYDRYKDHISIINMEAHINNVKLIRELGESVKQLLDRCEIKGNIKLKDVISMISMFKCNNSEILYENFIEITKTMQHICKETESHEYNNVAIKDNGIVEYLGDKFDGKSFRESINSCIEESKLLSNDLSIEQKLCNCVNVLNDEHPLVVKKVFLSIILPILINLFTNILTYSPATIYNTYITNPNHNEVIIYTKNKYASLPQLCNQINYNNIRFVSVDTLNVREGNSIKSRKIGDLKFGQEVRIIYKRKSWTLMEYVDDTDIRIKGWVFTRYLSSYR